MPSKILIADDDPLVRMLYKNHLKDAGYELITAKDGVEAIEIAAREQPQLLVMDIIMSQLGGLAALKQLKKTEATKAIPVVIVTGSVASDHQAIRRECENSGAAGFLIKPFSPAQLLAEVRRLAPQPADDSESDQTPGQEADSG